MKKSLVLILILLCSVLGFSQDTNTNSERLKKYWYMRWRLVNYFLVIGDSAGMSLPAFVRNSFNR